MSDTTTTTSSASSHPHHHHHLNHNGHLLHNAHHLPPTTTIPHPDPTLYYHKPYTNDLNNGSSPSHLTLLKPAQLHTWLPPPPTTSSHHNEDSSSPFSTSQTEMRYLELNAWDLNPNYNENSARVVLDSRTDSEGSINYRPWEKPDTTSTTPSTPSNNTNTSPSTNGVKENGVSSTDHDKSSPPTLTPLQNVFPTFTETFNGGSQNKLPSFQSQFNAFNEGNPQQNPPAPQQPQPAPPPPSHVLEATFLPPPPTTTSANVAARYAPPPPIAVHHHAAPPREPTFLQDNPHHIQLFPGQFPQLLGATNGHGHHHITPYTNGGGHFPVTTVQELVPVAPMHTIIHHPAAAVIQNKTTDTIPSLNLNVLDNHHFLPNGNGISLDSPHHVIVKLHQGGFIEQQQQQAPPPPQPPQQQQQTPQQVNKQVDLHQRSPQVNGNGTPSTPKRPGKRKKMENGLNGHHNNHIDPAQVSSVSSTDQSFKRPNLNGKMSMSNGSLDDSGLDKPVKKKRKRCGECMGCQRKDNCGDCAPCRNDKSHQICKQRRCDKLTEKKTPKSKLKQQQAQQQQAQQQPQMHI